MTRLREAYRAQLQVPLGAISGELAPMLGPAGIEFHPGWRRDELSLADALLLARDRDLQSGFNSIGPHRAVWHVSHGALPNGETLSRGPDQLTALTCVLAQAEHHAERRGEEPVVLLEIGN